MFTQEEAKGHGLSDDQGCRGTGTVFQTCGWPLHLPPPPSHPELCEGSGSKPGGVATSPGPSADFGGLIVAPSSYSLLCWGLRGLLALGGCCLCSCTEGPLQLLICLPPPTPGCPSGPGLCSVPPLASLASCVSIGLCSRAACLPSPAEALGLGPWQLEITTASRKGFTGVHRGPGRPSFPLNWTPLRVPNLLSFSHLTSSPEWMDHPLFLLPVRLLKVYFKVFIYSTFIWHLLYMNIDAGDTPVNKG